MNWVQACLRNKLLIYLSAIGLCLLGLFCLYSIPVTPFPQIQLNHVDIEFNYPGANAGTVQTQVTSKVVSALQAVGNVRSITSNSQAGYADVSLTLDSTNTSDLLQTQIQIMQAISSSHLPSAVHQPTVTVNMGGSELIYFIVSSDRLSLFNLDNFIQSTLTPKFRSLEGVSLMTSGQNSVIRIKLIPEKLAEYHLNPMEIGQRINSSYRSNPLGSLYVNEQPYALGFPDDMTTLQAFGNVVIGFQAHTIQPIYLKNVATIVFEPFEVEPNYYYDFKGHRADGIILLTKTSANPFVISKEAREYVTKLEKNLPNWLRINPLFDMAEVMHSSIKEVSITVFISSLLVLCISFIFLGRFRSTLIPIATIPICLLGTLAVINVLGFSLNILTLLAMVIAVGLVVDDAIVIVENITRHLENGMSKQEAVLYGTSDIALTIVGITATLLAVYLPITFCHGIFILLIQVFAIPLAIAVFISGIVALTLTPIMSLSLVSDGPPNAYQKKFSALLKTIIAVYQRMLHVVLNSPRMALLTISILIMVGGYFSLKLPKEYFPTDPSGSVRITLTSMPQDTMSTLRDRAAQFSLFYQNNTVDYYNLRIDKYGNSSQLTARLNIQYKPDYLHQNQKFVDQINAFIKDKHIANTSAQVSKFFNSGDNADLSFYLYGDDLEKLNTAAQYLTQLMKKSPMFISATNTINYPKKQFMFDVDYVKAAKFGLYKEQISEFLSTLYGGYALDNYFNISGLNVPVFVQLGVYDLKDPASLEKLQIKSPITNNYYPMSEFVSFKLVAKPSVISTYNDFPMVSINANLAKNVSLSGAMDFVNTLLKTEAPSFQYQYFGDAETYLEGNYQTVLVMVLGMFCIYFLLAVLFRSLLDPFIILLTVPFSIVGGALSLYLVGGTLNLFSVLGLITLIGLITKHGVLIVQFANEELRAKACTVKEAILMATQQRFRPIIMTTLAMTLGVLPLVLSYDVMYISRQNLGIVIVGGLLVGTFFSLFIVPLVYMLVKKVDAT